MTITDQIKILKRKIMQNEAQYDETEKLLKYKIFDLGKYEYLTGEDLDLKSSAVEQAKFEYSQLGKAFTRGLGKDDKNEGFFNRLKNIEMHKRA